MWPDLCNHFKCLLAMLICFVRFCVNVESYTSLLPPTIPLGMLSTVMEFMSELNRWAFAGQLVNMIINNLYEWCQVTDVSVLSITGAIVWKCLVCFTPQTSCCFNFILSHGNHQLRYTHQYTNTYISIL